MKKKQSQLKLLSVFFWFIIIIIGLVFLLFTFFLLRPFDNEITQDRPIMKTLCNMQFHCHSTSGGIYICSEDPSDYWYKKLSQWNGFYGCNNKTNGYNSVANELYVQHCGCGGIQ